eukprot:TRINITY_DN249_c0_g1_i2.p2 TRINITY_DN249_c0_g1~~TRINITY_DN249_c0_g1_i2.p2  ORF type:complete len:64 (+),score=0.02 TRINITY_DN249_c0_g1_i2:496-687(+)
MYCRFDKIGGTASRPGNLVWRLGKHGTTYLEDDNSGAFMSEILLVRLTETIYLRVAKCMIFKT